MGVPTGDYETDVPSKTFLTFKPSEKGGGFEGPPQGFLEKSNFRELVALPLAFCLQPGWGAGGGDPETQTKWKGKGKIAFLFFFGSQASSRGDHAIVIWRVPNFPLCHLVFLFALTVLRVKKVGQSWG